METAQTSQEIYETSSVVFAKADAFCVVTEEEGGIGRMVHGAYERLIGVGFRQEKRGSFFKLKVEVATLLQIFLV